MAKKICIRSSFTIEPEFHLHLIPQFIFSSHDGLFYEKLDDAIVVWKKLRYNEATTARKIAKT